MTRTNKQSILFGRGTGAVFEKINNQYNSDNKKSFVVDMNDVKSIKKGEKLKSQLENKSYKLIKAEIVGFEKYKYTYSKN